jgi:hypothetical protein
MRQIRFAWNVQLVDIRRSACPRAKWNPQQRVWAMTDEDAQRFLAASHRRLSLGRESTEIILDGERWVIGFAAGAPYRRT